MNNKNFVTKIILDGGVGILPTDTIYGIVASALEPKAVSRIYDIKKRSRTKRMTMIIADYSQLELLGIKATAKQLAELDKLWPGPISVDMKCSDEFDYLHLGFGSIAVRLPNNNVLVNLLKQTGPLATTSANLSGGLFLSKMSQIKNELPNLDFYVEGEVLGKQSALCSLDEDGRITWIRK